MKGACYEEVKDKTFGQQTSLLDEEQSGKIKFRFI